MHLRSAPRFPAICNLVASNRRIKQRVPSKAENKYPMKKEQREQLETVLGYRFASADRLEHALTHRSHRQSSEAVDNERLEFLGDRVLGLVASEQLCRLFPHWDAGKLS